MSAHEYWIEPFEAQNLGASWRGGYRNGDGGYFLLKTRAEGIGLGGAPCGYAYVADALPNACERMRRKCDYPGAFLSRQATERRSPVFRRGCADVAEILGDDQVGRETLHELSVYRVNAFAAIDERPDLAIDLARLCVRVYSRADQRGLACCLQWEIALVGHADDAIARANGVEDFGGGGQQ